MRHCPFCKSAWVCWNWFNSPGTTEWGHECHNCSAAFTTEGHVDDGIPHKVLMDFGEFFVEPGRFEREFAKDMDEMQKHFGRQPND